MRFEGKVALAFGNEHAGVHPDLVALADRLSTPIERMDFDIQEGDR